MSAVTMSLNIPAKDSARENLASDELSWVNLQPWLAVRGYRLRSRYQPEWQPSWLAKGFTGLYVDCEDWQSYLNPLVMDAVRVRDDALVMLKRVKKDEADLAWFLSKQPSSENHCVELYEILDIPESTEEVLLVMPLLHSVKRRLEFETVGEVVDFFRQVIEGLQFMHQQNVAYCDCKEDNILADSQELFNTRPHPLLIRHSYDGKTRVKQRYSTTRKPIRYCYIDFGLSRRYSSRIGNTEPSPWGAGLYKVPEFQVPLDTPTDPFPVDIYMLGMMIRQNYLEDFVFQGRIASSRRVNLEWMEGLARDMTLDDPRARPKIEEVVKRFDSLVKDLGAWKLRAPVHCAGDETSTRKKLRHWMVQASRAVRCIPSIPQS